MSPDLVDLAARHGVAVSYVDHAGRPTQVAPGAVVAALGALGVDAGTPEQVAAALSAADAAPWERLLPPSVVVRGAAGEVALHLPEADVADLALVVELEDGGRQDVAVPGHVVARREGAVELRAPLGGLPLGWHRLHASAGGRRASAVLCVAPQRLAAPDGPARAWGWMLQLYALRSRDSWAMGDYADLRTVVTDAAGRGAGVVLLNPLHAETPVLPLNPSPYSPSSRRFRSAAYLRVEDVPEHAAAPAEVQQAVAALRPAAEPDRVPRDPVWTAKLAALELLWPLHRAQDLAAWREQQGRPLEEHALFCALAERHGVPWQDWPEGLRRPDGADVPAAAEELADRVAFWCWVQLLVDEQLRPVADLDVVVVHDLAVGVDAGGSDAWALQDALALGTTVGAPPDLFNQQGQDWGLPPWRPDRLAEAGYLPFRDVVRAVLRHAGGLRIDHVMGLFRLWWVPQGASAADGTYVSYDADALLGVLALEAHRAGAVVVGEDLGTVAEGVGEALEATGVLGSAVLWFETDDDGAFLPPERWRTAALASVTTHDLPTAAGFLAEEHVRVRDELGQLGVPVEEEAARVREERAQLDRMLQETGLLERCDGDPALAMHAVLAEAPSRLVLAALGDAVGDLRQPNLPGTVDEYPNWRLPVADGDGRPLGLEELLADPRVARLAALLDAGVRGVR